MSNTSRSRPSAARGRGERGGQGGRSRGQGVSPLEAHLGYWLRIVSNHVSHAFKGKVERHGVTVAEWVVLRALFDEDGIKPSELAEAMGLTRGRDIEAARPSGGQGPGGRPRRRAGWARAGRHAGASGRRLVPKLAALADENDAETFGHLSPEQRAALLSTLKGIVERLGIGGAPVD
jgi:DNA-binding MarR family transcriptional regulator